MKIYQCQTTTKRSSMKIIRCNFQHQAINWKYPECIKHKCMIIQVYLLHMHKCKRYLLHMHKCKSSVDAQHIFCTFHQRTSKATVSQQRSETSVVATKLESLCIHHIDNHILAYKKKWVSLQLTRCK